MGPSQGYCSSPSNGCWFSQHRILLNVLNAIRLEREGKICNKMHQFLGPHYTLLVILILVSPWNLVSRQLASYLRLKNILAKCSRQMKPQSCTE
ncbi:hypothetical protein OIU77_003326 [Salix suchowensis]|uniref:Uncharacterized protein n=1 Tax=Salix suchowensis TaxID=1278906 RepID=A0ABQ9B0K3_9ROSI|nr:hypothetical protein OIU77_003326 [Salix suchowensis]